MSPMLRAVAGSHSHCCRLLRLNCYAPCSLADLILRRGLDDSSYLPLCRARVVAGVAHEEESCKPMQRQRAQLQPADSASFVGGAGGSPSLLEFPDPASLLLAPANEQLCLDGVEDV
eukprot:5522188-Pleurochrysis_carterae.AAC.1